MPSLRVTERAALADLLEQLGPDAPTLAGEWTTRELAAHLIVRERRPDATPGVALSWLAWHTSAVQAKAARRPYADLVADVRSGPPPWSPFAVPQVDRLFNTTELFIHHEDVRRAQPGWKPRVLPERSQETLWKAAGARARVALRGIGCGVVLVRPDGGRLVVRSDEPPVEISGEPQELLLYLYGRKDHARVSLSGPDDAQRRLGGTSLEV